MYSLSWSVNYCGAFQKWSRTFILPASLLLLFHATWKIWNGISNVAECVPSIHKALVFIPSTKKTKTKTLSWFLVYAIMLQGKTFQNMPSIVLKHQISRLAGIETLMPSETLRLFINWIFFFSHLAFGYYHPEIACLYFIYKYNEKIICE